MTRLGHALSLLVLLCATAMTNASTAEDFSGLKVEKNWKVTLYRANGSRPGQKPAIKLSQGGIGMAFTPDPNTALLTTTNPAYRGDLLGDLTGGTVHAEIAIVDAFNPVYNFYPDGCSTPANVRLYIRTLNKSLGESQYWWSNPTSISLAALTLNGSAGTTFDVDLDPANWSDRAGNFGNSDPIYAAAFASTVANVAETGLSFGGGCHFAFGVGVESGSATFQLKNLSVIR